MKFKDYFSLRQFVFAIVLFAVLLPFAIRDSNNQVKVSYDDSGISVRSNKYSMKVRYDEIEQVELSRLAEPGEKVKDGYDDDILRAGLWKNDTWGEYHIAADLDADNCVLMHLKDGRLFVISRKNNAETEKIYNTLLSNLK